MSCFDLSTNFCVRMGPYLWVREIVPSEAHKLRDLAVRNLNRVIEFLDIEHLSNLTETGVASWSSSGLSSRSNLDLTGIRLVIEKVGGGTPDAPWGETEFLGYLALELEQSGDALALEYFMDEKSEGKGLMSHAVFSVLPFLFHLPWSRPVRVLSMLIHPKNIRSKRIADILGFSSASISTHDQRQYRQAKDFLSFRLPYSPLGDAKYRGIMGVSFINTGLLAFKNTQKKNLIRAFTSPAASSRSSPRPSQDISLLPPQEKRKLFLKGVGSMHRVLALLLSGLWFRPNFKSRGGGVGPVSEFTSEEENLLLFLRLNPANEGKGEDTLPHECVANGSTRFKFPLATLSAEELEGTWRDDGLQDLKVQNGKITFLNSSQNFTLDSCPCCLGGVRWGSAQLIDFSPDKSFVVWADKRRIFCWRKQEEAERRGKDSDSEDSAFDDIFTSFDGSASLLAPLGGVWTASGVFKRVYRVEGAAVILMPEGYETSDRLRVIGSEMKWGDWSAKLPSEGQNRVCWSKGPINVTWLRKLESSPSMVLSSTALQEVKVNKDPTTKRREKKGAGRFESAQIQGIPKRQTEIARFASLPRDQTGADVPLEGEDTQGAQPLREYSRGNMTFTLSADAALLQKILDARTVKQAPGTLSLGLVSNHDETIYALRLFARNLGSAIFFLPLAAWQGGWFSSQGTRIFVSNTEVVIDGKPASEQLRFHCGSWRFCGRTPAPSSTPQEILWSNGIVWSRAKAPPRLYFRALPDAVRNFNGYASPLECSEGPLSRNLREFYGGWKKDFKGQGRPVSGVAIEELEGLWMEVGTGLVSVSCLSSTEARATSVSRGDGAPISPLSEEGKESGIRCIKKVGFGIQLGDMNLMYASSKALMWSREHRQRLWLKAPLRKHQPNPERVQSFHRLEERLKVDGRIQLQDVVAPRVPEWRRAALFSSTQVRRSRSDSDLSVLLSKRSKSKLASDGSLIFHPSVLDVTFEARAMWAEGRAEEGGL